MATNVLPHNEKVTSYSLDGFTLHAYNSGDPLGDISFIVETPNTLVVVEPQAFLTNIKEFKEILLALGKPVSKTFAVFHAGGLSKENMENVIAPKALVSFCDSDAAKGMIGYFQQTFGDTADFDIPEFTNVVANDATVEVDGVAFRFVDGNKLMVGDQIYYQHFAPAAGSHPSFHYIANHNALTTAPGELAKGREAVYFIGSHAPGVGQKKDYDFMMGYLATMSRVLEESSTAEAFVNGMEKAYPEAQGKENLETIAKNLFE